MKRKVFLVLALFALMAVGLYAQTEADFVTQNSSDGKSITITGYKGSATAVNIPARINNLPVSTIYAAFTNNNKITSITIPNGVTTIDMTAFAGTSITSIAIPNSVTTIGEDTFSDCVKLASVIIPKSVTKIGVRAFDGCTSLTSVTFEGTISSFNTTAFAGDLRAKYLDASGGIGTYTRPNGTSTTWTKGATAAATGTPGLKFDVTKDGKGYSVSRGTVVSGDIVIPATYNNLPVTEIALNAFNFGSGNTGINSVIIPNSVTSIESMAFQSCVNLKSVTIGSGVTNIGTNAFNGCASLTSVTFNGAIPSNNFNSTAFAGDLRAKYLAGGAGTYTRNGTTWTKK